MDKGAPNLEVIEWIDPVDEMPDADELVMIADRLGCICFASWDDDKGKWIEQMDTPHGSFSYEWQGQHAVAWAHMPAGPQS